MTFGAGIYIYMPYIYICIPVQTNIYIYIFFPTILDIWRWVIYGCPCHFVSRCSFGIQFESPENNESNLPKKDENMMKMQLQEQSEIYQSYNYDYIILLFKKTNNNPENGGDVRVCHHENPLKSHGFCCFFFLSFWKGQSNLPNSGKYVQLGNRQASWDLQNTSLES